MSIRPQYASTSLYVGDLSPEVSETVLYEFFNSVGPVASIRVCRDAGTRRSLGYAYVNYHSIADAERAMDTLNHTVIKSSPCRIMWSQRDPTLRRANNGNLYVKNLDKGVDNRVLHDTFSLFGNILSCKVVTDETGKSRGYGFVHFENDDAAAQAMRQVNGMKIWSKIVYVGPFCKKSDRQSGKTEHFTNLYTRNFPPSWDEDKLREIFNPYGDITSMWLSKDRHGRSFACINFDDVLSAKKAVSDLNGRRCNNEGLLPPTDSSAETTATTANPSVVPPAPEATGGEEEISNKHVDTADGDVAANQLNENNKQEGAADIADGDVTSNQPKDIYILFVDRAQDRSERGTNMKQKFDQKAQQLRAQYEGVNLYIKNLSDSVDDDTLRQMFEKFGTITSAKVMRDESGHSKGFGFVCFTAAEEATKAYAEMHLQVHDHKPLYVGLAEQKDRRHARLQQILRASNRGPLLGSGSAMAPPANYVGPSQNSAPVPPFFNPMMQGPAAAAPANQQTTQPAPQMMWQGPQPSQMIWKGPYVQGHMPIMPPQAVYANAAAHSGGNPQPQAMYRGMPAPRNMRHMENRPPSGHGGPTPAPGPPLSKQVLGEQLFPLVHKHQPHLAGKITGMMLDMEDSELLMLIDSETELKAKIDEALIVLEQAKTGKMN